MTDTITETYELSHPLVKISYQLKRIVDYIGGKASYIILPLIAFTMIDVFGRKLTNTAFDFQLINFKPMSVVEFQQFLTLCFVESYGIVINSGSNDTLHWNC